MVQIAIPDEVVSNLATGAASRGCREEDLALKLIEEGLIRDEELRLTPEQEARIMESAEQAKRGEFVDGNIVMARFDAALKAMEIR